MKTKVSSAISLALILSLRSGFTQGTFVYDQQSSIEGNNGEGAPVIQSNQPIGQSFAPMFSSLDFIRLRLLRASFGNLGATIHIEIHENSITGGVLASSLSMFFQSGFIGYGDFFFAASVAVTPGTTYFFQPVVESGDLFSVASGNAFGYSGGTAFFSGQPSAAEDLWFREGIVVPEPGAWVLFLVGVGALACRRRLMRSREG